MELIIQKLYQKHSNELQVQEKDAEENMSRIRDE